MAITGRPNPIRVATGARTPVRAGVSAMAPLVAGLVPFGLTVGATAARSDLPPLVGWASSVLLYGGSGQLALMGVLDGGGSVLAAVAATMAVNVQMLLYGAGMRPIWADQPRRWRAVAAYLLVGPLFAVTVTHHQTEADPARRRGFYLAAGTTLWVAWFVLTGIGAALGTVLPTVPAVGLLTPLVLLTMAVRAAKGRPGAVALVVGASVAVAAGTVAPDLGFVAGGITGMVAGVVTDRWSRPAQAEQVEDVADAVGTSPVPAAPSAAVAS